MAELVFNHVVDVTSEKDFLRLSSIITPNENKKQQEAKEVERIRKTFENIPFKIDNEKNR